VTKDAYAVRRLVGVCKQDDYLYPDLSAKEHLELFAGLRGVPQEKMPEVVQKWLASVDLEVVQNQFSASFSGGMKRRLSVACSTIGDRPCIVLDEPTTGMDPISRRFVWRHIDAIKEGRVVLLTTHAMEEADLLSDTVAVMRKGELAAFGTPLELKSEYGSALQFSLLVERDDASTTKEAILERFTNAHDWVAVDAGDAGNITVKIHRVRQGNEEEGVGVEELADFVSWLESDESGVSEYGFSNSSLEEVFLTLTEDGNDKEEEETDKLDVCCACCSKCCIGCCLSGPCRCCCRPRPHQHESEHLNESPERTDEVTQTVDEAAEPRRNHIATFQPVLTVRRQAEALVRFSFARNWSGKGSIPNWIIYGLFVLVILLVGIYAAAAYATIPAMTVPTAVLSLMLLNIVGPIYLDRKLELFYLLRTQGLLKRGYILGTSLYSFAIMFVYGFIALSLLYATPMFRDPTICSVNGYNNNCYYPVTIGWWDDEFNGQPVQLYAVPTAGSYGRIFGAVVFFALTMPGAALASSYIPGYKFALVCVVFIVLVVSSLPLGFYIAKSSFESYESLEQCGWDICNTTLSSLNILNLGSNSKEFLNCVGLEVHQSSSALGSLCIPPVASILPQFGLFQSLAMTLIGEIIFVSDPPEYVEQVLFPNLSGDVNCSGNTCVFPYSRWYYGATLGFMALGAVILLLLGIAQVSFFAFPDGVVLRIKNRISHALGHLRCGKSKRKKTYEQQLDEAAGEETPLEEVVEERAFVDSLVKPLVAPPEPEDMEKGGEEPGEVVVVDHGMIPREDLPPVLMYKLRKVYPSLGGLPPKVALDSLDLHVPKGQVLGLLGKNGGKS
jgi:ABC-type multidrug transport system ATPase subunit